MSGLKAKSEKAQRAKQNPFRFEVVSYYGSTYLIERVTSKNTSILTIESITKAEFLLTAEESTSWMLDSGASYHVTPFQPQFRSYIDRDFEPVHI